LSHRDQTQTVAAGSKTKRRGGKQS
jgi:hypothetical protein